MREYKIKQLICLIPSPQPPHEEGVVKACNPFSLREKAGMRVHKNQSVSFSDPLSLTLSLTLSRWGEGTFATPS
jgi:hypothetical protein